MTTSDAKGSVRDFWDAESCGEAMLDHEDPGLRLAELRAIRYEIEPYIPLFADFESGRDRDVLEIGVGMGSDHSMWAEASPRSLTGIDLTPRAVEFTRQHLDAAQLESELRVADAENLPFEDACFDLVYSWGVLHHSPDTPKAFKEVLRVLRPGGTAKVMIYHTHSLTGYLLWLRFGLLRLRPWLSLQKIYSAYLESPGTKAYTRREARDLCDGFSDVEIEIQLNHGDLLADHVGQRHPGKLLELGKMIWPRRMIRLFCSRLGLYLLITARKSE